MTRLPIAIVWLAAGAVLAGDGAGVVHLDSSEVAAAFEAGRPLVETEAYKVHASRRDAPGMAEVHARDTDIIYVLRGAATLVTGGSVVGAEATAPDEVRGSAIDGGDARRLVAGDVVVVPGGTAHWFREVEAPFLYYVVKVPAEGRSS